MNAIQTYFRQGATRTKNRSESGFKLKWWWGILARRLTGIVANHTDATLDESPRAYKNIFEVMELQSDLVDIIDRVRPFVNVKG